MTLEEAKKILKKEGYDVEKAGGSGSPSIIFTEYESPEICEAMQVVCSAGYGISMVSSCFMERKARLSLELAENSDASVSGKEQSKESNPALAEAASQFNDALLDEQAKKIEELTREKERHYSVNKRMIDVLDTLYNRMVSKNNKINGLGKEIARLNKIIHKKNEDLRLSKIREKNLTELCQKYIKANEELKKKLADKVVDKINANALKSAESALAYKEKVIAEKNEVIVDLGRKLNTQKDLVDDISLKYDGAKHNLKLRMDECDKLKKELYEAKMRQQQAYRSCADKNKKIEALKLQISAWEKRGNGIDWKRNADAIKLYVNRASHERLWNSINQDVCNEKELSFIINHGGKRVKYAIRFDGTDIVYECSDPDKKPSFFRDDSVGAVTNLKDCFPAKDTHSGVDIAEEGGDHSGVIVLCGKDFIDAIKKMK